MKESRHLVISIVSVPLHLDTMPVARPWIAHGPYPGLSDASDASSDRETSNYGGTLAFVNRSSTSPLMQVRLHACSDEEDQNSLPLRYTRTGLGFDGFGHRFTTSTADEAPGPDGPPGHSASHDQAPQRSCHSPWTLALLGYRFPAFCDNHPDVRCFPPPRMEARRHRGPGASDADRMVSLPLGGSPQAAGPPPRRSLAPTIVVEPERQKDVATSGLPDLADGADDSARLRCPLVGWTTRRAGSVYVNNQGPQP